MKHAIRLAGLGRTMCGAALLVLLTVCGVIGAGREETRAVSVPVFVKTLSSDELSADSIDETREKLRLAREREIALLDGVADEENAGEETIAGALEQKLQIAARMEQEALAEAALAYMGFGDAAVVSGGDTVSVFAPLAYMADEQSRVQIIDCICTHTGVSAEDVKIILSKK